LNFKLKESVFINMELV